MDERLLNRGSQSVSARGSASVAAVPESGQLQFELTEKKKSKKASVIVDSLPGGGGQAAPYSPQHRRSKPKHRSIAIDRIERPFEQLLNRVGHITAPYVIEFIGTFFLVLTVNCTELMEVSTQKALAVGSVLMVCVFMGGHISGAHYNPAVTIGVLMSGRDLISYTRAALYIVVQLCSGLLAAVLGYYLTEKPFPGIEPHEGFSRGQVFWAESLFTFILVTVVLNVATTRSQDKNSYFGLGIGFTVLAGASAVGGISGGAFNPAVATAGTVLHAYHSEDGTYEYLYIYWLGELCGALVATVTFRITNPGEYDNDWADPARNIDVEEGMYYDLEQA